jgi:hypothetical protein
VPHASGSLPLTIHTVHSVTCSAKMPTTQFPHLPACAQSLLYTSSAISIGHLCCAPRGHHSVTTASLHKLHLSLILLIKLCITPRKVSWAGWGWMPACLSHHCLPSKIQRCRTPSAPSTYAVGHHPRSRLLPYAAVAGKQKFFDTSYTLVITGASKIEAQNGNQARSAVRKPFAKHVKPNGLEILRSSRLLTPETHRQLSLLDPDCRIWIG